MTDLRVVVPDDDVLLREGLASLLERSGLRASKLFSATAAGAGHYR